MAREKTWNFKTWLDGIDVDSAVEMSAIYRTVKGEVGYTYKLIPINGGNFLLRADLYDVDLILTPKSRDAFVCHMDSLYELGVEGQATYELAIAKPD